MIRDDWPAAYILLQAKGYCHDGIEGPQDSEV